MTLRRRLTSAAALATTTLLLLSADGLAQATAAASPTEAVSSEVEASSEATSDEAPDATNLVEPAAASEVTSYSDQAISINFPKAWEVETIENGIMIANVTTVPTELVATQVVNIEAPPGAVVNANIDSFVEEGASVGRYRTVTIDEQSALVMWLSDRPDELSAAIATFIGYGDQTVLLFSRYSPENATAEEHILQMHTSFANLAIQTASAETSETESVEQ